MYTLQALPSRRITIPDGVRINVQIAVALGTRNGTSKPSCWIPEVPIRARVAPVSRVPQRTLRAHDDVFVHLDARPSVGAPARLAVRRGASKRVPVVPPSAQLAVVSRRVVSADASARLRVADFRVLVAVARDARHEGPAERRGVSEAGGAGFAELAHVSGWAAALLDPEGGSAGDESAGGLELDVVEEAHAARRVGGADLDGGQVGEDAHESAGGETGLPAVVGVLVEAEAVVLDLRRAKKVQ